MDTFQVYAATYRTGDYYYMAIREGAMEEDETPEDYFPDADEIEEIEDKGALEIDGVVDLCDDYFCIAASSRWKF